MFLNVFLVYFCSWGQRLVTKGVGKWIFPCYNFYTSLLVMKLTAMTLTNNSLYVIAQTLTPLIPVWEGVSIAAFRVAAEPKLLILIQSGMQTISIMWNNAKAYFQHYLSFCSALSLDYSLQKRLQILQQALQNPSVLTTHTGYNFSSFKDSFIHKLSLIRTWTYCIWSVQHSKFTKCPAEMFWIFCLRVCHPKCT